MKHLVFCAAILSLVAACPGYSNWGGGACGPVGPSVPPMVAPSPFLGYEWVQTDPDQFALKLADRQIGSYVISEGKYYPFSNGSWGAASEPPVQAPVSAQKATRQCLCCRICDKETCCCTPKDKCWPGCHCGEAKKTETKDAPIFGCDSKKITKGKHILNGREVSREEVISAIEAVPNDASRNRLTVIGPDEARAAVLKDLQNDPSLKELASSLLVTDFLPTDWQVAKAGFDVTGTPRIVYLSPDGRVLHSQGDYEGGAAALAQALRKANENYDPKKDPDLRKSDPLAELKNLLSKLDDVPPVVWIGLAVVLFLLIRKGK